MPERCNLRDASFAHAWNLQGSGHDVPFIDAVARAFRIALPTVPNTTIRDNELVALWLGPRSWLLLAESPSPRFHALASKRDAINLAGGALFEVSASRVAFRVSGPRAIDVLATACPLDLAPRAFPAGACAQSVLGRINVLIYKEGEEPTFLVMVARSYARDTRQRLAEAATRP